jgi:hypothetical protein
LQVKPVYFTFFNIARLARAGRGAQKPWQGRRDSFVAIRKVGGIAAIGSIAVPETCLDRSW